MNIIQPAHMNHARMGTVSVCIWGMIGEIRHCAIEIINGTKASCLAGSTCCKIAISPTTPRPGQLGANARLCGRSPAISRVFLPWVTRLTTRCSKGVSIPPKLTMATMNVASTVNGRVGRAHSDLCSGSEFALVLLPPQENASLSATQQQIQKKIFPRILWPKGLECSNYVLRERCKWRHSLERV